ncbi:ketohydroxyglutarate aldolase [Leptolyngbya sp. NK1-12]|uniref:Ketohydroxyglutarate aldolase n=1 Tax=Leptolyngbya sp. NK1-12 TaxID=2547451 RepID=A0AA97AEU9_9CYAN|nr:ketohydroxyglutarate aldolase [Leptolyngbya sp. NK1-12]WNZ22455.1 ketohydroxyglutarate aldolase [Leptolyngbya sp. NK1-12]
MSDLEVTVLVDDQHRGQISEVVEALQAAGMRVAQCMQQIGVVAGTIESTQMDRLCQIEGVAAVEPSQSYQLEPPDSEVQ